MQRTIWLLLSCILIVAVKCFPDSTTVSLVSTTATPSTPSTSTPASSTEKETETNGEEKATTTEAIKNDVPVLPKIYEMRVDTNISNRFAKTQVTSKVKNLNKNAHETVFSVVIPDQAYISGFTMEIDGKSYEAYVQEKEEAKQTYNQAVAGGQAAAHVSVNARDSNRFTVSVNVEPQSKAIFYLRYEELLARQNDKYELVINIHPGQPVKKLDVEVHIEESRPLKFVKTLPLRTGNEISKDNEKLNPDAEVTDVNKTSAIVKFSPDVEKQKQYASALSTELDNGLSGQFIVQYDVEKDPQGGEVLVDGGYFVHFFAPDQPALPKQVVFILDTSGSMEGIRIQQLKEAMKSILSELKQEDVFNIVEFGTAVKVWNIEKVAVEYDSETGNVWLYPDENPEAPYINKTEQSFPPAYAANEDNVKKAIEVISRLNAYGGTDIQSALKTGIKLVEKNKEKSQTHQPLMIFLTDGEPTVGEVRTVKITRTISELNSDGTPIFSLSFGEGADRNFLQKLSLKNFGFARHIYEAADASLQLEEFYKQISSPLLSNVTFQYVSNVANVTKTQFPILFHGSELVVSGQIDPDFAPPIVRGWGINGPVELTPVVEKSVGSLERLWAYLTLKQILEQRNAADNKTGPTQEALRIALKYSFVSDVTSLVVVKPNASSAVETEDASDKGNGYPILSGAGGGGLPLSFQLSRPAQPGYNSAQLGFASANNFNNNFQPVPLAEPVPASYPPPKVPIAEPEQQEETTELTEATTEDEKKETEDEDPELRYVIVKLPWILSILNENGTISISSGSYELGLNETIDENPECSNSASGDTGKCVLINKCPQVFTQVTNVEVYEKYFCALERYAGICCPVIEQLKSS